MMLSAASTGIWPPDWSQFIPDLLVSLPVGVFLWWWASGFQKRADKKAALDSWESNRELVAHALRAPFDRFRVKQDILSTKDGIPEPTITAGYFTDIVRQFWNLPIIRWSQAAPHNKELKLTRQLIEDGTKLEHAAGAVEAAIYPALIAAGVDHHSTGSLGLHTGMLILQVPDTTRYLAAFTKEKAEGPITNALAQPELSSRVEEFRTVLVRVERNYEELRRMLREP